jgi:hypothetical protein
LLFLRRSPRAPPADDALRVAAHSTPPPSLAALQADDGAFKATAVAGNGARSVILGVPFRGAVQTIPSQTVPADHVVEIDSRRTPEEMAALEPKTSSAAKTPRHSDAFNAMPHGPFATTDAATNAFTAFVRQTGYDVRRRAAEGGGRLLLRLCRRRPRQRALLLAGWWTRAAGAAAAVRSFHSHRSCRLPASVRGRRSAFRIRVHRRRSRTRARLCPRQASEVARTAARAAAQCDEYRNKSVHRNALAGCLVK